MPKVLIIAGVSILALGLVLCLALPGLAAPEVAPLWFDECEIRIVKGEVLSVGDGEFDIQSGDKGLTIRVGGETKYYKLCFPGRIMALAQHLMQFRHQNQEELGVPGGQGMRLRLQNQVFPLDNGDIPEPQRARLKWLRPFGAEAEFSDIEVGDRVVVWLGENDYAERVLIIKPTTYACVSGTIRDVSSGEKTITIAPEDGEAVTLHYNEGTVFILKGIILLEAEVEPFARAVYNTETTMAKVVWVWSEAPQLAD